MKKLILSSIALAACAIASAVPVPGSLAVDFRDAAWSGANGQHQYTVNDVTATGYALKFNFLAPDTIVNANLSQSATDGIAVDSKIAGEDPGEVGPREILDIDFAGTSGNGLTGVWITQLFTEIVSDFGHVALYNLSGLFTTIDFDGAGNDVDGNLWVDFGGAQNLTSAVFYADSSVISVPFNRDYSVAGFTAKVVSDPVSVPDNSMTAMLLGVTLLGLGAARRATRNA